MEGIPEDVRRYRLALQAWPRGPGLGGGTPHDVCRAETRQALVVDPDEDRPRFMIGEAVFAQ